MLHDTDNDLQKSADFRVDDAVPIVDLLIQMGDDTMISYLSRMEKEKEKETEKERKMEKEENKDSDENKNENKRKINKKDIKKKSSNVVSVKQEEDSPYEIDLRTFSVLSEGQLESFKIILKLLNARQLKALQFASR